MQGSQTYTEQEITELIILDYLSNDDDEAELIDNYYSDDDEL